MVEPSPATQVRRPWAGQRAGHCKTRRRSARRRPRADECTLILTEGDSAKTFAVSGLAVVGRELYGVFPLKGAPLNVRGATSNEIARNEELRKVATILGLSLRPGQTNIDLKVLRYGRLMIMADQVLALTRGDDCIRPPNLAVWGHPVGL